MADLEKLKSEFIKAAEALEGQLMKMSDVFYHHPELGMEEWKTTGAMQDLLKEFGFDLQRESGGVPTAFKASIGRGGPVIALLAEMDALPGIGHGCGHNIAGTASVGAAAALSGVLRNNLPAGKGTLVVIGTPAEELGRGKIELLNAGVFDGIDAAMMVHGSSKRTVVKHFLGLIRLDFIFHGKASHASAYPEEGINALDAVIQTFNSVAALRQQMKGDARVHGIITDGGKAPNIIPERSEAVFFVRSRDMRELESLKERVINCARGAATATGCALTVQDIGELNAPMKVNMAFAGLYRGALDYLGLKEDRKDVEKNLGSSDIGNVSQVLPTIHPHIPVREGINIHTKEFAEATISPDGHRALMEGVKCLGLCSLELLFNPRALEAIKKDFRDSMP